MNTEKIRNIKLYCPVCGNDQFSCMDEAYDDLTDAPDTTQIKCADCQAVFTKAALIDANKDIIDANLEEMAQEIIGDFEKQLRKALK